MGKTLAKKIILCPFDVSITRQVYHPACGSGGSVAITKVAAFIQGPSEAMKDGFSSTPEADLVTALMFLNKQIRDPTTFSYFSQVYLPFFLVHALPGRSLIISGVGEPTISVRHSSIPSLVQMRADLRNVERIELVPKLLGEFIQTFETPATELIVIRNAMMPTMIDPLRVLVDEGIPPPGDEVCLPSRLSSKEIHDVGILFRNERARLDANLSQLSQAERLVDEFVEENIRLLDARRDRMSHGASLRWEARQVESEPKPSFFGDEPTAELDKEKERISSELAEVVSRLANTLGLSTEQCRRLVSSIKAKPTEVEWHIANVKTRLVELENTASVFQLSIQQALTELDEKTEELREARTRYQWDQEQSRLEPGQSSIPPPFPSGTLVYSESMPPDVAESAQLSELNMIREAIIKLHAAVKDSLQNLKNRVEKEHRRFEAISAPADTMQGYLPLMQVVIPIFVVKIGQGDGQYGVIPPLKVERVMGAQSKVSLFNEVFGEQLIQLMRTEIRSNRAFQRQLDEIAMRANWVKRPFSSEHLQRGTRQLANYALMTYEMREQLASFWSKILMM